MTFPVSTIPGGWKWGYLNVGFPPLISRGVGGVAADWALPCPPSFPARRRGRGTGDNPYT